MAEYAIEMLNITKKFPGIVANDNITLQLRKGEIHALLGENGAGKSTLLHMLGGLDTPTSGRVIVDGNDISGMTRDELTIFRRRNIGFVFQNYNLLPLMNVWENIVLPIRLDGIRPDQKFVDGLLSMLGLTNKKYAMPNQLSGGQQQRVALARALASKPAMILADEPTGNLDSKSGSEVMELLQNVWKKMGTKLVVITHDSRVAQMADRQFVIVDGVLSEAPAK